jgi:hypothetical protein
MCARVLKSLIGALALVFLGLMPVALSAQAAAAAKGSGSSDDYASRWDEFVGYSYLAPHGTVQTPLPNGTTEPYNYRAINDGEIISFARYFNRYVGAEISGDMHLQDEHYTFNYVTVNANDFSGGSLGLIVRLPSNTVTPFAHAAVGGEHAGGPYGQLDKWGPVLTVGGGLDYATPLYHRHIQIRLFQADYQYTHEDFGPGVYGGRGNANMARLSAGVVFKFGSIVPPPPVTLACSASPTSIFPGDPVTVTATAGNLNPKLTATYTWTGTGVTGNGATASVSTGALTAATYTVTGHVTEGPKPGQSADCSASFTVKAYEPPTVSCSASPSTIKPGDTSTITAVGVSPQNRPLTYSYSATSGTISGTGTTAAYNSAGAATGGVGITCNVADDKGQTASAQTTVTITAPPPPVITYILPLCSIKFSTDMKRPARVDNEAKACLDQVAIDLKEPGNKIYIVGESTATEKELPKHHKKNAKVEDLASERAVNARDYLVNDAGADGSRITLYTGPADSQQVETFLLKPDAQDNFNTLVPGAQAADASVKVTTRSAITQQQYDQATSPQPKPHHKKAATKPAAGK